MNGCIALLLPPAVALAGLRLLRLLLGAEFSVRYGFGFRFAIGLGLGMLVFTQAVLLGALTGFNLAGLLGRTALIWGLVEFVLLVLRGSLGLRQFQFQKAHLWLLLLTPLLYYFWVLARLSVVEGMIEFDAVTHWAFKSKILYHTQGQEFLRLMHNPNLAYFHLDYPFLVSALYTLTYGALGGVDEFVLKTWPFWMVASLCLAVLSLADTWRRPRPLPIAIAYIVCFLPATISYVTREGATIPKVFFASLAVLLIVRALGWKDVQALAAAILLLAGCAMAKFEGMIYAALWLVVLLPICWRRRWFRDASLWKAALVAFVCLLPYAAYRLNKPIPHYESNWSQVARHSPKASLKNFPRLLGLGVGGRFFSRKFFVWNAEGKRLRWDGRWDGWKTFINYQLGVIPWLGLVVLGLALWRRHHHTTLICLSLVTAAVLVCLAFVIACVPHSPGNEAAFIVSKIGEDMGRYYYPYFMAWFLGIVSVWFYKTSPDPQPPAVNAT